MLDSFNEFNNYTLNNIQGTLQTVMLATSLFPNICGECRKKIGNYSRQYTIYFQLFMAVPSSDYYLSINNK